MTTTRPTSPSSPALEPERPRLSTRVTRGVRRFVTVLIVEPIREGRLKDTGWSPGLGTIVVCSTVAFVLAVALVLAAPSLREVFPLVVTSASGSLSVPRFLLPLFFILIALSVALLQSAALHTRALITVPVTITTCSVLLFLGGLDRQPVHPLVPLTLGQMVSVAGAATVIAITAFRRRRAFVWWEFAVLLTAIGATAALCLGSSARDGAAYGVDFGPSTASLMMSSLGSLAVPAAVAAGVAVAELAVTLSLAIVAAVRPRRALDRNYPLARSVLLWFFLALAVAVVLIGIVRIVDGSAAPTFAQLAGSLLLFGLIALGMVVVTRTRAPRDYSGLPSTGVTTTELRSRLGGLLFPVAAALTAILGPLAVLLLIAQILFSWGVPGEASGTLLVAVDVSTSVTVNGALRTLAAVIFIVVGLVWARRGQRATPELLVGFGVMVLVTSAPELFSLSIPWSSDAIALLMTVATLVIAVILAVQRRVTERALAALTTALLLALAVAWRDVLADPLSELLGASAIATILLGFVWGFLTGAAPTREGSARYPVPVRVLLFLANSVFGVTVLAFAALARDLDAAIDLDKFTGIGDGILGTAFLLVLSLALWAGVFRSRPQRGTVS